MVDSISRLQQARRHPPVTSWDRIEVYLRFVSFFTTEPPDFILVRSTPDKDLHKARAVPDDIGTRPHLSSTCRTPIVSEPVYPRPRPGPTSSWLSSTKTSQVPYAWYGDVTFEKGLCGIKEWSLALS